MSIRGPYPEAVPSYQPQIGVRYILAETSEIGRQAGRLQTPHLSDLVGGEDTLRIHPGDIKLADIEM